jgi:hypothetical protein
MLLANVPAIVKAFTNKETAFDIAAEYSKASVSMAHTQFEADIQLTFAPEGVTVTAYTPDTQPFELFSPAYNNFTPHNLIALRLHN